MIHQSHLLLCSLPLLGLLACVDKGGSTDDTAQDTTEDTADDTAAETDEDGDGDGYTATDGDCDDTDPAISPGAAEVCDGIDNDCDDLIDDADDSVTGQSTWYTDADGDSYGDAAGPLAACVAPSGHVADSTDCNDTDPAIHPAADEVCDSLDNDCDDLIDDADDSVTDQATWYTDTDGDGYGNNAGGILSCAQPSGTLSVGGDCDDSDNLINPDAQESCQDGVDTDCDGVGDDACTACSDLSVIAYYDSFMTPPLNAAVEGLGMTLSSTADPTTFGSTYTLSSWDAIIVDIPGSSVPTEVQSAIVSQLSSGDKVIFSYWDLDADSTLQTTLGVRVVRSFNAPLPLYANTSSALWEQYEILPNPISNYSDDAGDNGDVIAAVDPKTAETLAFYDAKGSEAAIVATFGGQVIVNGFLPWDYQDTDDNGNGVSDMVELYTNELIWMFDCTL